MANVPFFGTLLALLIGMNTTTATTATKTSSDLITTLRGLATVNTIAGRKAFEKAVTKIWDRLPAEQREGGWNPCGGEANDCDVSDLYDCEFFHRVPGVGLVVVVRMKRAEYVYALRNVGNYRVLVSLERDRG